MKSWLGIRSRTYTMWILFLDVSLVSQRAARSRVFWKKTSCCPVSTQRKTLYLRKSPSSGGTKTTTSYWTSSTTVQTPTPRTRSSEAESWVSLIGTKKETSPSAWRSSGSQTANSTSVTSQRWTSRSESSWTSQVCMNPPHRTRLIQHENKTSASVLLIVNKSETESVPDCGTEPHYISNKSQPDLPSTGAARSRISRRPSEYMHTIIR